MPQRKITRANADPARKIHPDLPNHVATWAQFIAAAEEGVASLEKGPTVSTRPSAPSYARSSTPRIDPLQAG